VVEELDAGVALPDVELASELPVDPLFFAGELVLEPPLPAFA